MPTFKTNDIRIHFTHEGQGEPVMLIHGFPLSVDMWRPQRAALSQRYNVYSIDLRGFGRSDPPTGAMSIDTYADDVVALLNALGIGQAVVGGLSMGGYITMALLRRHPERVKAVMLLDTKMTPDTALGRQGRNEMIVQARTEGPASIAAAMLPKMLTPATVQANPALTEHVRTLMATASVPGLICALEALRERPDSTMTLKNARVPALIVVGSADTLTPAAESGAMQEVMHNAFVIEIPGAAHLSTLEQPSLVDAALLAFLDQHGC
ncbi:MAG: alpha/beta fold hydrolase [Herpetosiphonaceae bacterium]|nr:alpha/beta fold hydrolase [Herpetosiphonaceae bacterium]